MQRFARFCKLAQNAAFSCITILKTPHFQPFLCNPMQKPRKIYAAQKHPKIQANQSVYFALTQHPKNPQPKFSPEFTGRRSSIQRPHKTITSTYF